MTYRLLFLFSIFICGCADDDPQVKSRDDGSNGETSPMAPPWANSQVAITPADPEMVPGPQTTPETHANVAGMPRPESEQAAGAESTGGAPHSESVSAEGGSMVERHPESAGDSTDQGGIADIGGAGNVGGTGGHHDADDHLAGEPEVVDIGGIREPLSIGGEPLDGAELPPVDCSQISRANRHWEVCEADENQCAGVFTDGAGCTRYCAAAGLVCLARYGGQEGCGITRNRPIPCDARNGHRSDWCVCGLESSASSTEEAPSQNDHDGDCRD